MVLRCMQKHSYGFRAKVSDYGILRELDSRGFATPQCYPALAHLAPEVLLHGKVSKARNLLVSSLGNLHKRASWCCACPNNQQNV